MYPFAHPSLDYQAYQWMRPDESPLIQASFLPLSSEQAPLLLSYASALSENNPIPAYPQKYGMH